MSSAFKNISKGIFYTGLTKYSGIVISIIIGAILARLLTPNEFGLVALVTVFIAFFNILSDVGIGPAIIQKKDLTKGDQQSIFFITILIGFFLAVIFFLSSNLIASFYSNKVIVSIVKLLSLSVFFSSLKIVPNALLLKKLKFKQVGVITITVQLLSGCVTIYFAYQGYGYFALVYKSIFDSFFTFIFLFGLNPIKLKLSISYVAIKKIFTFSAFQFLFNFINYFARNLDNLLIGKFIGPVALGYYDKSYQLMLLPVHNLTHVITPVLHPVLSEFQNEKNKIYDSYVIVVKLLALIGFPLSVFLWFSANEIIEILFGNQWELSIPVFKILALTIGFQTVLSSSGSIFQSLNRTDLLFYSGLISSVCIGIGVFYGVFIGRTLEDVGLGILIAISLNFFQGFYLLVKFGFKESYFQFLKIFAYPLFISLMLALTLIFLTPSADNEVINLITFVLVSFFITVTFILLNGEYRRVIKSTYRKTKNIKNK